MIRIRISDQDHSDHGASKEPLNPLLTRIQRFLWCAMIRVILINDPDLDHSKGTHPISLHVRYTSDNISLPSLQNNLKTGNDQIQGFLENVSTRRWIFHSLKSCAWYLEIIPPHNISNLSKISLAAAARAILDNFEILDHCSVEQFPNISITCESYYYLFWRGRLLK